MKKDKRIEHVDDERSIGNSIIISLKPGYQYDACSGQNVVNDAHHVFGVDAPEDIATEMLLVSPCECVECRKALGIAP